MRVTRRGVQIALGLIWVLDAALQFQPYMFSRSFATQTLAPSALGNPQWIAAPVHWIAQIVSHYPTQWNTLFALFQLALGVGILWKRTTRVALAGSMAWAVLVWWLGEGMGGLFAGGASPLMGTPGAVLLYLALAVLVFPSPSDRSNDMAWLREGRISIAPRLVWSLLWLSFALESLSATNRAPDGISSMLGAMASGEPGWLASLNRSASAGSAGHGQLISVLLAIGFTAIALCVFAPPPLTRTVLVFAGILSLAIWVVAQDFGGMLTGTATDPNTGPLLVLLAVAFWPNRASLPRAAQAASPGTHQLAVDHSLT
jgi:hypothetical protein